MDVEDDFEHGLTSRKLGSVEFMLFIMVVSSWLPVYGRSAGISVLGMNQTRQHNDTKIAIRSICMFPFARPRSVDDFCHLSRLQTRSNDAKTQILLSSKFRFPDTNPQRG